MGIEDLNLDLGEHAERILVIAASAEASGRIGRLLEQRAYSYCSAADLAEASALADEELFDMVIAECSDDSSALDAVHAIVANAQLRRAPLLVLHPKAESVSAEQLEAFPIPVRLLGSPWEASALLVRVSSQLRIRKVKETEARFTSRVAEQNVQLRDLTTRFKRELQDAQYIQNSLLPKGLPSAEQTRFAATYVPLEAVGGDLYDLWKLPDGRMGLFIGDVTGHGLPAAFIGAMTKMALSYSGKGTPDEMLAEMNSGLCQHMPEGRFVTAAAAFYTPATGELYVARAGHPPGFLYRAATRELVQVAPRGVPLGFLEEARYELYSTRLEAGDKFLLVTDGITEAMNFGGAVLGVDGTARLFAELAPENAMDSCLRGLLEKQEEFSEGRMVKDDITLLGLERLAAG